MKLWFSLLLKKGSKVNKRNNVGETALYLSVVNGHANVEIKEKSENMDYIAENTAVSSHAKIVYMLLKAGANIKESSSDYNPCTVHLRTQKLKKMDVNILKMLSAAGADIQDTGLATSKQTLQDLLREFIRRQLREKHPERNLFITVSQLNLPHMLENYLLFDVLQYDEKLAKPYQEKFPLEIPDGDIHSITNLFQAGVDVNVQDENGMTILMKASEVGRIDLIEELIKNGADPNLKSVLGKTALMHAVGKNNPECVEKLIQLGAKVNTPGLDGVTALAISAQFNTPKCVQSLLKFGADPNIPDAIGNTPLMNAVAFAGLDCVEKLISAGADVNFTMFEKTAIAAATRYGKENVLKLLIETGVDINCNVHKYGLTPLMVASIFGHIECLKLLIQSRVDLDMEDESGRTALQHAARSFESSCFTTLLKAGADIHTNFIADLARKPSLPDESTGSRFHLFPGSAMNCMNS